jgi:hypothetical protein
VHRWEPERLFLLAYTAYFDESGTHDGEAVTIMGAVIGRADQWKEFGRKYNEIRRRHGFKVFHMKRFKAKSGDFRGWSDDQRATLFEEIRALTSFGLTDCVAIALDNETYKNTYRMAANKTKAQLDSAYGLCFRMCLYYLVVEISRVTSSLSCF